MAFLDFFSCCGRRKDKVKDIEASSAETASLLPPHPRAESVLSAEGGYGALDPSAGPSQGLTDEQRVRIEAIGREVGNHMLPIHAIPPGQRGSPSLSKRSHNTDLAHGGGGGGRNRGPSFSSSLSRGSSRPSSPSPDRPDTTPADGTLRSPHRSEADGVEDEDDEGVVKKTVFLGALGSGAGGRGGRKASGRGKAKRGRGRGK